VSVGRERRRGLDMRVGAWDTEWRKARCESNDEMSSMGKRILHTMRRGRSCLS